MHLCIKRQGEAAMKRGNFGICGYWTGIYLWWLLTFVLTKKMLELHPRTEKWLFVKGLLLKLLFQATGGSMVSKHTWVITVKVSIKVVKDNWAAEKVFPAFPGIIEAKPIPADFWYGKTDLFGKRIICPFYHLCV